jgi:hypothetical protein
MALSLVPRAQHRGHASAASERELRSPTVDQIADVQHEIRGRASDSFSMGHAVERMP